MNSQAIASSSKKEQVPSSIIQVVILRNEDNTLCIPPTKYINRLIENHERLFGYKPKSTDHSPLERATLRFTILNFYMLQEFKVLNPLLIFATGQFHLHGLILPQQL